jgi:cephalosporin hydroxylase
MGHLRRSFDHLTNDGTTATAEADAAVAAERRMEKIYRQAMSDLLSCEDLREVMARRELYRRLLAAGERMAEVAERVWYAVVKEG